MKNYLTRIFGQKSFHPFVVICHPRTGSNLLLSYLDDHPNIKARGEIFKALKGRSIKEIYSSFMHREASGVKAKGFKILYSHPEDGDPAELLRWIDGIPDMLIIHLTRSEKLSTLTSLEIAKQTDVWGLRINEPGISIEKKQIRIEKAAALKFLEEITAEEKRIDARYQKRKSYLQITYEDLINDTEGILQSICQALNVPYTKMRTKYKRSNPEDLRQLIANYAELEAAGIVARFNNPA